MHFCSATHHIFQRENVQHHIFQRKMFSITFCKAKCSAKSKKTKQSKKQRCKNIFLQRTHIFFILFELKKRDPLFILTVLKLCYIFYIVFFLEKSLFIKASALFCSPQNYYFGVNKTLRKDFLYRIFILKKK